MRVSYEGDIQQAQTLLPEAKRAFYRTSMAHKGQSGQWRTPLSKGHCIVTLGRGIDGVHIVYAPEKEEDIGRVQRIHSGVVLDQGQLAALPDGKGGTVRMLDAFSMTAANKEEYGHKHTAIYSRDLPVVGHASMPTRMDNIGLDTQYTVQQAAYYTGKMSKLVQLVLGYGLPMREEILSRAMAALLHENPTALPAEKSTFFSKENANGIQNTFNWGYQRTHGIFVRTVQNDDGTTSEENWLIEISKTDGVRAMPLQLEPITTTPQFKGYIAAQCAKSDHKAFFDDIALVLKEFGGYPTNKGFLTVDKDQIITLIEPGTMEKYEKGRGVSTDTGWAFNSTGTMANNVCLEPMGATQDWFMAHHCQISIKYDDAAKKLTAEYAVLESGSAPIGHGKLKVGDTAFDRCVSYNMSCRLHGGFSGRPRARNTAMYVFYREDRLVVLRWDDGSVSTPPASKQNWGPSNTQYPFGESGSDKWSGSTGVGAGFFSDGYDARLPTFGKHIATRRTYTLGGEWSRTIAYDPAWDTADNFYRRFWTKTTDRTTTSTGSQTWNSCAFVPLGDRSAFYIATMVQTPNIVEQQTSEIGTINDPYSYVARETYIWNFDLGTQCGRKFPFKFGGTTLDGIYAVVWDRSGATGRVMLDHYCQHYVRAPYGYVGGGYYGWSRDLQDRLDAWSAATGQSEWYGIGAEPIEKTTPCNLTRDPQYTKTLQATETQLEVRLFSLGHNDIVFFRKGSYLQMYKDYWYWFDPSPNSDGDFQTMWTRRNCFGSAKFQLWSTDVNDSNLAVGGGYPLTNRNFPTFIGVVDELAPW